MNEGGAILFISEWENAIIQAHQKLWAIADIPAFT